MSGWRRRRGRSRKRSELWRELTTAVGTEARKKEEVGLPTRAGARVLRKDATTAALRRGGKMKNSLSKAEAKVSVTASSALVEGRLLAEAHGMLQSGLHATIADRERREVT